MFKPVFAKIQILCSRIANIGITDSLNYNETKKTQLLNIVIACGIPTSFTFCFINFFQQNYLLSCINVFILLGGILILTINSYQKFLLGRLIISFCATLFFTASAILYRNGGEYFLIANLIVIIIYFNEIKFLLSITLLNCLLFIAIKYYLNSPVNYYTVPFGRIIFNMIWSMATGLLALLFFKNEQIIYQKQIEEKNKELEKLNQTKQKLFSIIAHDLRSPIAQLKGSLELVNKDYISPEVFKEISAQLFYEVDQLQSTLDNILRWSLSQFEGIQTKPEKISLPEVVKGKLALFETSRKKKNITIHLESIDLFIWADPDHFKLAIRNLLSNALKYSYPNSAIIIRGSTKDKQVIIEIADKGIGLNDEMKYSLFNAVTMNSTIGTLQEKGTGLGLKLCKEFIEKNNGKVWVESIENVGSSFYISLPSAN